MEATATLTEAAADGLDLPTRYRQVRDLTEELARPLSPEDQTVQTMPDVSPTKWHRAHTTWFFETFLLQEYQPGYVPVEPDYQFLFNSYYEAVGPRHARPERGLLSRPGVAEIAAYRAAVDEAMNGFVARDLSPDQAARVTLGLNHEQQHQELLLMDIKHVLSVNPRRPAYREPSHPAPPGAAGSPAPGWIEHPGGVVHVGHDGSGFGFDNEGPRHSILLEPFAVSAHLVTCGQWLEFMADGGYRRSELWMSDGWGLACREGWEAPAYWHQGADGWVIHTLSGVHPVRRDEPVCHVSWYEADAFARWAGYRLPREAEWEVVAADRVADSSVVGVPGLSAASVREPGTGLHPTPPPCGSDTEPVDREQWFGSVWQWTADSYDPYPGFTPAAGAVGEYNGKFMVNQKVLRGSACVTPVGHSRPTYRNFYYPSARWPFCGLRLAVSR